MAQTVIDWSQSYATWVAGDGVALSTFTIAQGTTSPHAWDWANLVASYIAADYDLTHRGAALSVKGRASNSTGVIADIAAANDGEVLRRSGTSIGFGTVATAGIANDAVTFAKMQNITTDRLLGRDTAGSGDVEEIELSTGLEFSGSSRLRVATAGIGDAQLRNSGARSVIGRAANSSGAPADISGAGADTILTDDGSTLAFRSRVGANLVHTLLRDGSALDVTNTTTPTAIASFTVPANTVVAGSIIRGYVVGHYLNNSGSIRNFIIRVNVGGTTITTDTGPNFSSAASPRRPMRIDFEVFFPSTSSQRAWIRFCAGNMNAATDGYGDLATTDTFSCTNVCDTDGAVAMSSNRVVELTIEHSFAANTISFQRLYAVMEMV